MPNEARKQWDCLKSACKEVGLLEPIMQPFGLGNKVAIRVGSPGPGCYLGGDTMEEVIYYAMLYVRGYQDGLEQVIQVDSVDQMAHEGEAV